MRDTMPKFEGAVRRDFFDPKPVKRAKSPTDYWRIPLWWANAAVTVALAAVVITHQESPSRPVPIQAAVPVPAPTPAPLVAPTPEPLALRATPVEPVVRRGLPVEGQLYLVQMDNRNILVRFMGAVRDFDALPKHSNLYDYYQVTSTGHAWILMRRGFSAPAWVDP